TDVLTFGARTEVRSSLDINIRPPVDRRTPAFFAMANVTRKVQVAVEFSRKSLASNQFSGEWFTRWSSVSAHRASRSQARTVERVTSYSTVHRLESESSVDITADAVPELNRFSPVT